MLGELTLRNRFIKTATYEGMSHHGVPSDDLIEFHRRIAEGGVGMTTVAYGAVNEDGLTNENQIVVDESSLPFLERLTKAVHGEGAAASLQLTHCGYFTKSSRYKSKRPLAPSKVLNKYGLLSGRGFSRPMDKKDLEETRKAYQNAARIAKKAGFDAVEVHMGHGYLLSQFLTPAINKRDDQYGGSFENRLRFPLEVISSIREAVGNGFAIICKLNMADGFKGGLIMEDSLRIAEALEKAGVNGLMLSGGYTSRTPFYLMRGEVPLKEMVRGEANLVQKITMAVFGRMIIREYPFEENFFFGMAKKFRERLNLPLVYVGGVVSSQGIAGIMEQGFDMIALGRALIHDPDFVKRVKASPAHVSECNQCNVCVATMDEGLSCPIGIST